VLGQYPIRLESFNSDQILHGEVGSGSSVSLWIIDRIQNEAI